MSSPQDLRYTRTHEWVRVEGELATIGITDYAQNELGDITYLELPEVGSEITQNEPLGVVESVKAASDIYAPISGQVVERNETVIDSPDLLNRSPYEEAWLLRIRPTDPSQIEALMSAEEYDAFATQAAH
ncbi:MAG TPA: glycine cleavage system protein GcvH [Thermomicrobiales bacterium]